jgi:hypothetical protein
VADDAIQAAAEAASVTDQLASSQRRLATLSRWDKTTDRKAAMQPAREGLVAKYREEVLEENPGLTDEAEIQNRVERKLRIHYERMRLSSLKTRRANAAAKRQATIDALADAITTESPEPAT